jgi:glycolate oxidase iron-sulfur subunit
MKHSIPSDEYGPLTREMANAVTKCVHCGFCLPTCPTYIVLREEIDSPRGRIILMKSVLEGNVELEEAIPYIDHCLGCLGCVTVCPSGVDYGELLMPFRAFTEEQRYKPPGKRFSRWIIKETLPYPRKFNSATKISGFAKPISSILPKQFQVMLDLVPDKISPHDTLPSLYPAMGERRARIALLTGCVQQILAREINWATLRVLSRNGVEVIIPQNQGCCGALALHTGDTKSAQALAANNLEVFPTDVDAIITNAAGCGSAVHEYPLLFRNTDLEDKSREFSQRVYDITVFLTQLGIEPIPPLTNPLKIAYQDACHLAHAQGITKEPRELLLMVPNLTLVPIQQRELCCGSAGSYNLEQPEIAQQLGERKVENILEAEVDAVVTGNIGCLIQLRMHLAQLINKNGVNQEIPPVCHTIELIDKAYREFS